jgi:RNA polymerase sigma-70 factor (ECF subfamily)
MAAQISELEAHRTALTGHCYRMLGSAVDADDAVQETMVRAWQALDGFDGRSSLRTWLYRVATNVCLDALAHRSRRERPISSGPKGTIHDTLEQKERAHWLEPIADALAVAHDESPAQQLILRQSIRLAFVATLQHLPPKQRAALILSDVLDWSAQETASCLETTVQAINSALQRARATLANADLDRVATLRPEHSELVERYAAAFERYDIDALSSMLRQDAVLSMPPYTLWLQGHAAIAAWMSGPGAGCHGSRLVPTVACGSPAFAQYRNGGRDAWALIVLELAGDQIASITSFMDVSTLFPRFGMRMSLLD